MMYYPYYRSSQILSRANPTDQNIFEYFLYVIKKIVDTIYLIQFLESNLVIKI
jgi:hypothetical protein